MDREVRIVTDKYGRKLVIIDAICFKGKRNIDWDEVKNYLMEYVGAVYEILESGDCVYIGSYLPDEFSGSRYTRKLMGTVAKA